VGRLRVRKEVELGGSRDVPDALHVAAHHKKMSDSERVRYKLQVTSY
jgi:hypothetical protein